jgi:hypothetical protein
MFRRNAPGAARKKSRRMVCAGGMDKNLTSGYLQK